MMDQHYDDRLDERSHDRARSACQDERSSYEGYMR
jgi:hypothetical protein